jgi:hypothetical protein
VSLPTVAHAVLKGQKKVDAQWHYQFDFRTIEYKETGQQCISKDLSQEGQEITPSC